MKGWMRTAAALGIIGAIILLLFWHPTPTGIERLRDLMKSYGPWAVLVSAGLMVAQAIVAPIPGNFITIANGLVFGPLWGGLLSYSTILLGSTLCFGLSKALGKPFARRIVGAATLEKAEQFFKRYGLQAVFVVRITPLVPFDAVSYAAGLVGVPFAKFLLATAVGIIPSVIVYSFIGSVAVSAYWILVVLLSIGLVALLVLPRLIRRKLTATSSLPFAAQGVERTAAD